MVDNHIRQIKKNLFKELIYEGTAHSNVFSGANIKRLDHSISPTMVENQLDIVIIHIISNDITHNDQIDGKDIVNRIINFGKKCLSYEVQEVTV